MSALILCSNNNRCTYFYRSFCCLSRLRITINALPSWFWPRLLAPIPQNESTGESLKQNVSKSAILLRKGVTSIRSASPVLSNSLRNFGCWSNLSSRTLSIFGVVLMISKLLYGIAYDLNLDICPVMSNLRFQALCFIKCVSRILCVCSNMLGQIRTMVDELPNVSVQNEGLKGELAFIA